MYFPIINIELAPCTNDPCKRGRCISKDNITYECECQPGWRGDHCEESKFSG